MVSFSGLGALPGVAEGVAEVAARVRKSVVLIRAGSLGQGSGIIWSSPGQIVTNAHVAQHHRVSVETEDGEVNEGVVVARDPGLDLAIIETRAGEPALEIVDPADLRVGELVIAIGNPLGVRGAATLGVYCGLHEEDWGGRMPARSYVRADVDLYPGNSGGPLVDSRGRLIGINSMVTGPGFALAIPASTASRMAGAHGAFVQRLGIRVREVETTRPRAGVRAADDTRVLVLGVMPGGAGAAAGLLPGDLVLSVDGEPTHTIGDLHRRLLRPRGLDHARLALARGGALATVVASLSPAASANVL